MNAKQLSDELVKLEYNFVRWVEEPTEVQMDGWKAIVKSPKTGQEFEMSYLPFGVVEGGD